MPKQVMPSSSTKVERYTPRWIFAGLNFVFDIDPAAPVGDAPSKYWCHASFTKEDDGLSRTWVGSVWLNPPWTRGAKRKWIQRLREHGNGIALVRGGVDSKWLHDNAPDAILLLRGRVQYLRADAAEERGRKGGATGGFEPSMLLAYGQECAKVLMCAQLDGIKCRVAKAETDIGS